MTSYHPGLHETHTCKDCGAVITVPYVTQPSVMAAPSRIEPRTVLDLVRYATNINPRLGMKVGILVAAFNRETDHS